MQSPCLWREKRAEIIADRRRATVSGYEKTAAGECRWRFGI
ncbi:hypothetical protein CHUV0807_0941 [Cardiobacterium hominis]|uniref:Uncharacterized protein n=1 Tax=Cardiobacterium hominis TaxID=2718 RepID=A0A1C3H3U7_9GAMM|nr:hypothetical protein CHUV0807_0941 [Cardiobacterium hominis]